MFSWQFSVTGSKCWNWKKGRWYEKLKQISSSKKGQNSYKNLLQSYVLLSVDESNDGKQVMKVVIYLMALKEELSEDSMLDFVVLANKTKLFLGCTENITKYFIICSVFIRCLRNVTNNKNSLNKKRP